MPKKPVQRAIQIIVEFKPTTQSTEDAEKRGTEILEKIKTVCNPEHTEIHIWEI